MVAVQQVASLGKQAIGVVPDLEPARPVFEAASFLNFDLTLSKPGCAAPVMSYEQYLGSKIRRKKKNNHTKQNPSSKNNNNDKTNNNPTTTITTTTTTTPPQQ